jgi:hypothetical protein
MLLEQRPKFSKSISVTSQDWTSNVVAFCNYVLASLFAFPFPRLLFLLILRWPALCSPSQFFFGFRRTQPMNAYRRSIRVALLFAAAMWFALITTSSYAEVKPGDFISTSNADKVRDLVSPGVY